MGSAAGQAAEALPAAQLSSWLLPSAERIRILVALSVSGRHSCSLLALVTQILPLWVTSMSQMLGFLAISPARSAPKRPRVDAAEASASWPAAKLPGPRKVCALLGPSTVTTSPP